MYSSLNLQRAPLNWLDQFDILGNSSKSLESVVVFVLKILTAVNWKGKEQNQ